MNHLNEETIMEVLADLLNGGYLEDYDTEEQMHIIELVTAGIKKYHAKELDKFLEGLHKEYQYNDKKRNLSDL